MHRRDVLRRIGALGTLAVGGSASASARRRRNPCSIEGRSEASASDGTCLRPPGSGGTPVAPRREYIGDVEFVVVASGAEVREPTSEITIGDHGTLVEVRQTVSVSNGCKEVGLVGVNYDPESRTLGITTESVNPHLDDPVPCTMAVEPHTYEATVTMQRGTVDAVLVGHEGSDLATETR